VRRFYPGAPHFLSNLALEPDSVTPAPKPFGARTYVPLPPVGRSMLKRFQMDGRTLEAHEVSDRLLLTY
jgi:hypothetical protein